jgi:hypothetical protein
VAEAQGRSWLRCGCLGCLAVVGLHVLAGGVVVGIAWLRAGSAQVEDRQIVTEIVPPSPPPGEASGPAATPADAVEPTGAARPHRVRLDLSQGYFEVGRAEPGQGLSVDARFDVNSYELTQDETTSDAGETVHDIRFRATHTSWLTVLQELFAGSEPKVEVALPAGTPIALELRLSEGGFEIDLGGLWLTEVEIVAEKGGGRVAVTEPVAHPVESFVLTSSMAGVQADALGNASPRKLTIEGNMGGFEIDLGGAWRADSEIDIETKMGGSTLRLPHDVRIVGLDVGTIDVPDEAEVGRPTLRFTTSSQMGDLEIVP